MSVFSDDWRECLREQYKSVIRNADSVTLPSLTAVMERVGFGEDEMRQLRIEATMHVDDVPEGFVPDLEILTELEAERTYEPHPLECQCPACMEMNLKPHDDEGQPLTGDELLEYEEREQFEAAEDDAPNQLSMF